MEFPVHDLLLSPPAAESRDALESPKELEKLDPGENPQEADTWNGPGESLLWGHPSPSWLDLLEHTPVWGALGRLQAPDLLEGRCQVVAVIPDISRVLLGS